MRMNSTTSVSTGADLANIPRPKFKKGQAVRYNFEKRKEFFQYIKDHPDCGNMPTVPLRIWTAPEWNGTEWIYHYEYGWTSEGSAVEKDLEAVHITDRFTAR